MGGKNFVMFHELQKNSVYFFGLYDETHYFDAFKQWDEILRRI